MNEKIKNLIVLTDNVELIERSYSEAFSSIKYNEVVKYQSIKETIKVNSDDVNIIVINDISNINNCDLVKIISFVSNNYISLIYTNDNELFLHWCGEYVNTDGILHDLDFDSFISKIQSKFEPRNTVIAFVSDNDKFMNDMFDKAINATNEEYVEFNELSSLKKQPLPIGPYIPKIVECWIYDFWYRKYRDIIKDEVGNIDNSIYYNATVNRIITIKTDKDEAITYIWIKPSKDTDLFDCTKCFDYLFIDVCSYYDNLIVDDRYSECMHIAKFASKKFDKDDNELLNVCRNTIKLKDITNLTSIPYDVTKITGKSGTLTLSNIFRLSIDL